ncbi:MAG: hypothetical protein WAV55_06190 [Clostridiaceae bacterium]
MIISFLAPRGGVGSSTLAVLTASHRALTQRILLIDAAPDYSIDLYTSTENSVPNYYSETHQLSDESVRGMDNCWVARIDPDRPLHLEEFGAWLQTDRISDVIIDFGVASNKALELALAISDKLIVVLTQDNPVLRASDHLLGKIRSTRGDAGFIINQWEARDISELGDQEEIFSLLEEDCVGVVSYDHNLRFLMNQGKPLEVPHHVAAEIQGICDKIYQGSNPPEEGTSEPEMMIDAVITSSAKITSDIDITTIVEVADETETTAEMTLAKDPIDEFDLTAGDEFKSTEVQLESLDDEIESVEGESDLKDAEIKSNPAEPGLADLQVEQSVQTSGTERSEGGKEPEREGVLTRIRSFFRGGKG